MSQLIRSAPKLGEALLPVIGTVLTKKIASSTLHSGKTFSTKTDKGETGPDIQKSARHLHTESFAMPGSTLSETPLAHSLFSRHIQPAPVEKVKAPVHSNSPIPTIQLEKGVPLSEMTLIHCDEDFEPFKEKTLSEKIWWQLMGQSSSHYHVTDLASSENFKNGIPSMKVTRKEGESEAEYESRKEMSKRFYVQAGLPAYTYMQKIDGIPAVVQLEFPCGATHTDEMRDTEYLRTPVAKGLVKAIWVPTKRMTPEFIKKQWGIDRGMLESMTPDEVAALNLSPTILKILGYKG